MGRMQMGLQGLKGRLVGGTEDPSGGGMMGGTYHRPPPPPPPPPSGPALGRPSSSSSFMATYLSPSGTDPIMGKKGKAEIGSGRRKWWGGKAENAGWKKKLFCCCCLCCGCFCVRPMRLRNRIICLILGALLIGTIAALTYLLWPRFPEVTLVGARPGKLGGPMEPRVAGTVLTLPVSLAFVAQSPNYIPFQVGNISVTGYTLPRGQTTPVEIGTGGLTQGISLAARALTPFSLPFILSYDVRHPGGAAAVKEAMVMCGTAGGKLPLSYRADISLPLIDWTGKHPSISGRVDVACPFSASSLSAIPGVKELLGGLGGAGAGAAGGGSDDVDVGSVSLGAGSSGSASSPGGAGVGSVPLGPSPSSASRAPAPAPRAAPAPAAASRQRR